MTEVVSLQPTPHRTAFEKETLSAIYSHCDKRARDPIKIENKCINV